MASRLGGGGCPKEASVTGVGFAYKISMSSCYWGEGVPGNLQISSAVWPFGQVVIPVICLNNAVMTSLKTPAWPVV